MKGHVTSIKHTLGLDVTLELSATRLGRLVYDALADSDGPLRVTRHYRVHLNNCRRLGRFHKVKRRHTWKMKRMEDD